MPVRESTKRFGFVNSAKPNPREQESPEFFSETLPAAFSEGNDVVAAVNYFTRPTFKDEEGFVLQERLAQSKYAKNEKNSFLGVRSNKEFDYIEAELDKEFKNLETLSRSGPAGFAALIAAGMVSPTIAIPVVGPAKNVAQGVRQGAALGAAGGVIQETVLAAGSERVETADELGFNIAAGAIFNGVLGGGVGYLRGAARERAEQALLDPDTYDNNLEETIPQGIVPDSSVGAAEVKIPKTKGMANALVPQKAYSFISPVMRNINQNTSDVYRWATHQLSNGGLTPEQARVRTTKSKQGETLFEGGEAVAPQGTLESLIKVETDAPLFRIFTDIDAAYGEYVLGRQASNMADRAKVIKNSLKPAANILSKTDFRRQIGKALLSEDTHHIPAVEKAAKKIRKELDLDHKKNLEAGLYKETDLVGDPSYLHRVYSKKIIEQNPRKFIDKLATHVETKLQKEFVKKLNRFQDYKKKQQEVIEAFDKPLKEAKEEITALRQQLKDIESSVPTQVKDLEIKLKQLRKRKTNLSKERETLARDEELKALREEIRELEKNTALKEVRADRRDVRKRLNALTKANEILGEKHARILETIEDIETKNINRLIRIGNKGGVLRRKADKLSVTVLQRELKKYQKALGRRLDVYYNGEKKIEKLLTKEPDESNLRKITRLDELEVKRKALAEKADKKVMASEDKLTFRQELIAELDETMLEAAKIADALNKRQFARLARLEKQLTKFSPERLQEIRKGLVDSISQREGDLYEDLRVMGAEDADLEVGTANFRDYAEQIADETKRTILGLENRTAGIDIIQSERGPALKRVLDIPGLDIEEFIELDVEQVLKQYFRSTVPDRLIKERFGDVNGGQIKLKGLDELDERVKQIENNSELSEVDKRKQIAVLNDAFRSHEKDFDAMIGRLRGTHGIPSDPTQIGNRLGRVALQLNATRLMGRVVASSVADIGRPVIKDGMLRTMRDAWIPLITDFKRIKMTRDELRLYGLATDLVNQSRSRGMFDTMEVLGTGTKFERGLEFLSSKLGLVNGLDYWNSNMKALSGVVTIGRFTDSLKTVVEGTGSIRARKKAMEFLASHNIDGDKAELIYAQLKKPGGSDDVNGFLLPNTETWTPETQSLFRAAVVGHVDNTIITPGLERPVMSDSSVFGRIMFQFKSFGLSSTYKTTIAGLQQRDMAMFNGIAFNLALGAFSWYVTAQIAGGLQLDRMLNASAEEWLDEAINRSGLMGILADAQRIASHSPLLKDYTQFGEGRLVRGSGAEVFELIGGPTAGLLKNTFNVATGQNPIRNARMMLPYQNLIGLSRGFDAVEEALQGLN